LRNGETVNRMHEIVVNLHMHTRYSDGTGLHREIARAALRAGLDVVIVTDHNVLVRGFDGYYRDGERRVLMLVGQEVHDQARHPQKSHLLIVGAKRDLAPLAHDPQALINAVQQAGGLCFLAHPHEPPAPLFGETAISWEDWQVQGFTGLEIWNHLSQLKYVLTSWPSVVFHIFFPMFFAIAPDPATLQKWDELLSMGRRVVAVGGSDAHELRYRFGPFTKLIFPYEFHFRALNTHLLVDAPLRGNAEHDAQRVLDALRLGRGWVGFDLLASTRGFRFSAQGRQGEAVMGEEIALGDGVTLQVLLPEPAEVSLWRNGQRVQTWKRTARCVHAVREPGAYRVEVHRRHFGRRRGWIYSNPIYVRKTGVKD